MYLQEGNIIMEGAMSAANLTCKSPKEPLKRLRTNEDKGFGTFHLP